MPLSITTAEDVETVFRLARGLLASRSHSLGPDHPDTLAARTAYAEAAAARTVMRLRLGLTPTQRKAVAALLVDGPR